MRNEKWAPGSLVSSGPLFLDSWNPLGCVCLLAQWEVLSRPGFAAMALPVFLHLSAFALLRMNLFSISSSM